MSKPNPFQRGAAPGSQQPPGLLSSLAQTTSPQPNTRQTTNPIATPFTTPKPSSPTTAQPTIQTDQFNTAEKLGRNFSRSGVRMEEEKAKKAQYRHFILEQQSNSNLMSKSAGRKMGIDTKRPVHKVWMLMMAGMSLYIVAKWTYALTKPKFFTIFNLPSQGYSASLMSPAELQFLGPMGDEPKFTGKHKSLQEQHAEKKERAEFNQLSPLEQERQVPCFQFGREFKQCMSPGNITRKLDQCMLPLQQYNMCLVQYRSGVVGVGQEKLTMDGVDLLSKPIGIHTVPVEHSDFKYH